MAGKVTVAVFAKTSKPTENGLKVCSVRFPTSSGVLGDIHEAIEDLDEAGKDVTMEEAMAVTHEVNLLDSEPLGDPHEVTMLFFTKRTTKTTQRSLQGGELVGYVQCARSRSE